MIRYNNRYEQHHEIKRLESGCNNIVIFIPGSLFVICNLIILAKKIERLQGNEANIYQINYSKDCGCLKYRDVITIVYGQILQLSSLHCLHLHGYKCRIHIEL